MNQVHDSQKGHHFPRTFCQHCWYFFSSLVTWLHDGRLQEGSTWNNQPKAANVFFLFFLCAAAADFWLLRGNNLFYFLVQTFVDIGSSRPLSLTVCFTVKIHVLDRLEKSKDGNNNLLWCMYLETSQYPCMALSTHISYSMFVSIRSKCPTLFDL